MTCPGCANVNHMRQIVERQIARAVAAEERAGKRNVARLERDNDALRNENRRLRIALAEVTKTK